MGIMEKKVEATFLWFRGLGVTVGFWGQSLQASEAASFRTTQPLRSQCWQAGALFGLASQTQRGDVGSFFGFAGVI